MNQPEEPIDHVVSIAPWGSRCEVVCSCGFRTDDVANRQEGSQAAFAHRRDVSGSPDWRLHEDEWAGDCCDRCGHDDHSSSDCPTVTPDLLKHWTS